MTTFMRRADPGRPVRRVVTFPPELWDWLCDKAEAERRSLQDQAIYMLEQLKRAEEAAAGHTPA